MADRQRFVAISLIFLSVVYAQETKERVACNDDQPGRCYTLYKSTGGHLTWTQARQLCSKYNETLAGVPDLDSQQSLEELTNGTSNLKAWLAGKVISDERWQWLNGDIYTSSKLNYSQLAEPTDEKANCGYLVATETVTEFHSASCDNYKSILCKYDKTASSCESGDIQVGTVCFRRITDGVTWYSAVTECHRLGYTLTGYEPGLLSLNRTLLTNRNFWLQVNRFPWKWETEDGIKAVKYYSWAEGFGTSKPDYCIYVTSNSGKWESQPCNSSTGVYYAVCEKDSTITTASVATTASISTTDESTTETRSIHTNTTENTRSSSDSDSSDRVIILSVVAGLVCLILLAVIILLCRRKKKGRKDRTVSSSAAAPSTLSVKREDGSQIRGENSTIPKGYVYYNDSYEWTEETKAMPYGSVAASTSRQTTTVASRRTAADAERQRQADANGDPELYVSWSELCRKYVAGAAGFDQRRRSDDGEPKRSKPKKGKAAKAPKDERRPASRPSGNSRRQ